jgi:uncharacterized delta-60 repeat protein
MADGAMRSGYPVSANGRIEAISLTSNGKLLIGGTFWSQPDRFVARVNSDGMIDASFKSGLKLNFSMEAGISVLAVQPDGKVLVGGNFDTDAGFSFLARLNTDGSVDGTFNRQNGAILYPNAIVVLDDGKILVGGTADASGRGFVRRLNADGSVDSTFAEVALDRAAEAVAIDGAGRIVFGGSFTMVNGAPHERLARLNSDGSADASWAIGANNVVKAITRDPNGGVVVGGAFSEIGGVAQSGIARLKEANASSLATDGEVHLSLGAKAGRTYVIQSSNDLKTWQDWGTQAATAEGLRVSASMRTGARQFFRAREVE